jgi:hypothetical protein
MCAAGCDYWARSTNCFRRILAIASTRTAFAIWMEEHFGRKLTAGAFVLPFPMICDWER